MAQTIVRGQTVGRTDEGVDIGIPSPQGGRPIYDPVPGVSKLVGRIANWYAGQPLYDYQVQNGPFKGAFWYLAEQVRNPRRQASQGQQIATTADHGSGLEVGWAANASGQTRAQATTGYTEGQVTPAGSGFRSQIINARGRPKLTGANTINVPGYVPKQYRSWVRTAAQDTNLPAALVAAQINTESSFDPQSTSPTGAQGIAQFEPGTWKTYGHGNPYDPVAARDAYVKFMNALLRQYHGNVRDALAAYNAGSGNLAAGYGYADTILAKAGVSTSATATGGKPTYGATRPGGQPASSPPGSTSSGVDQLFANYMQERSTPRVAPPGTKNPFQWWMMSFTGSWQQDTGGA